MSSGADKLKQVTLEIRRLFHRLASAAQTIHVGLEIHPPQRALLEDLLRNGEQTIPLMADKRSVSRQHILKTVNQLKEKELVEFRENPEHRRSFLVTLSASGKKLITRMTRKEDLVFQELAAEFKSRDLEVTLDVLNRLGELLPSSSKEN